MASTLLYSMVGLAVVSTTEEVIAVTEIPVTHFEREIERLIIDSGGRRFSELEALDIFKSVIDSADTNLSEFLRDQGQRPLLANGSNRSASTIQNLNDLEKGLDKLKRFTEVEPKGFDNVLARLGLRGDIVLRRLENRVRHALFRGTEQRAELEAEVKILSEVKWALDSKINELDEKLAQVEQFNRRLVALASSPDIRPEVAESLSTVVIPELSNVTTNMLMLRKIGLGFKAQLENRIAGESRILGQLKTTVEVAVPSFALTTRVPINLTPLDPAAGRSQTEILAAVKARHSQLLAHLKQGHQFIMLRLAESMPTLKAQLKLKKVRAALAGAALIVMGTTDFGARHDGLTVNDIIHNANRSPNAEQIDRELLQYGTKFIANLNSSEAMTLADAMDPGFKSTFLKDYATAHVKDLSADEIIYICDMADKTASDIMLNYLKARFVGMPVSEAEELLEFSPVSLGTFPRGYLEANPGAVSPRQAIRIADASLNSAEAKAAIVYYANLNKGHLSEADYELLSSAFVDLTIRP